MFVNKGTESTISPGVDPNVPCTAIFGWPGVHVDTLRLEEDRVANLQTLTTEFLATSM